MNKNFNVKNLARDTEDAYSAGSFNSWVNVVRLLDNRGFNSWEAEAILRSKHVRWACDEFGIGAGKPNTANTLAKYLDKHNITHRCKEANDLVMGTFGEEYKLELNDEGLPCRRGRMPGNPEGGTVLVPVGTPLCCDVTSQTYWSM